MATNFDNKEWTQADKDKFAAERKAERDAAYKMIDSSAKAVFSSPSNLRKMLEYATRSNMSIQNALFVWGQTQGNPVFVYSTNTIKNSGKYYVEKGQKSKIKIFEQDSLYTDATGKERTGSSLKAAFAVNQLIDKTTEQKAALAPDHGLCRPVNPAIMAHALYEANKGDCLKAQGKTVYDPSRKKILVDLTEKRTDPKKFSQDILMAMAQQNYAVDAAKYPISFEGNPQAVNAASIADANNSAALACHMFCVKHQLPGLSDAALNQVCAEVKVLPAAAQRQILSRASRIEGKLDSRSLRLQISNISKQVEAAQKPQQKTNDGPTMG